MRLIDAEDFLDSFYVASAGQDEAFIAAVEMVVEDTLTIDAEPVVRCNMCKYYEAEVGFCHYHGHGMHWDDFCSRCAKMDLEEPDEQDV